MNTPEPPLPNLPGFIADEDRESQADWSPDGNSLAIVQDLGARDRIEYPIGTPLYETSGVISMLRVSPDGDRVAFGEYPQRGDDRGLIKVVDRGATLSVDGRLLLGQDSKNTWQVVDLTSGALRAAAGLQPTDIVAGWSNDGSAAFVARVRQVPARLERVNLQSGVRTFIRELAPVDRTGVSLIFPTSIIDDGQGYAYFYVRDVATWYVVQDTGVGR
jgi:dipeptidyl aminopeptidase/acylaminoacyl peptidase